MTIKERIIVAAFAAISTDRPSGVPVPVRTRLDSPSADQLPALTMYQGPEVVAPMREPAQDVDTSSDPVVRRVLALKVETIVAAVAVGADALADPIVEWVIVSMIGAGDFGGLADRVVMEIGTEPEYEEADLKYVRMLTTFEIQYQTLIGDPTKHDETE